MASFDNENIFAYRSELADQTPLDSSLSEKDRYDIATRLAGSVPGIPSDIFNIARDIDYGLQSRASEMTPVEKRLSPFSNIGLMEYSGEAPQPLPPYEERLLTTEYFQKKLGGDPQNPMSMVGDILSMVTQPEVGAVKLAKFIGMFPFLTKIEKTSDKIEAIDTQLARSNSELVQDRPSGQRRTDLDNKIFALGGAREELIEIQKAERQAEKTGLQQVTFDLDTASKAEKQKRIGELIQSQKNITDPEQIKKVQEEVKRIGQSLNVRKAPDTKGLKVFEAQDKQFNDRVRNLTAEENYGNRAFPNDLERAALEEPKIYQSQLRSPIIDSMVRAPQNLKGEQILEWASKNTKAKELEFTGLDDFIRNNPDATMDDAIKHVNENQVRITKDARDFGDDSAPQMTFDYETARQDPITLSEMYDSAIQDVAQFLALDNRVMRSEAIRFLHEDGLINGTGALELEKTANLRDRGLNPDEFFEEIKKYSGYDGDVDDLAEGIAKMRYYDDPFEIIYPNVGGETQAFGDTTFAIGRDDDGAGYNIFVDGERKNADAIYSRTEAEIQLRDAIVETQGTDPYRLADEYDEFGESFQQYIDKNLPGGDNYREITFNWDNADEIHYFGHDELNQEGTAIAHALVRDRKLMDGTSTLHIDETQSNLHQKGAKEGYKISKPKLESARIKLNRFLNSKSDKDYFANVNLETNPNKVKFEMGISSVFPDDTKVIVKHTDSNGKVQLNEFSEHEINMISRMAKSIEKNTINSAAEEGFPINSSLFKPVERKKFGDMAYDPEAINKLNNEVTPRFQQNIGIETGEYFETYQSVYGSREADMLVKAFGKDLHKLNDIMEPIRKTKSGVPNYPYKDDWHKMVLKKMILEAIQNGDEAISSSPARIISERYSDRYDEFYGILYDDKIPAEMKKLANKYGGKFEKGDLSLTNVYGDRPDKFDGDLELPNYSNEEIENLTANILRITPEMKEKILAEGLEKFKDGGIVGSINIFEDN